MTSQTSKAITVFFLAGLGSGVLTAALTHYYGFFVWTSVGVVFVFGVAVSLLIARVNGWVLLKLSAKDYGRFTLITAIGYPLSILVMVSGMRLYSTLYRLLLADSLAGRVKGGDGIVVGDEAIVVGLYSASVAAALILSFALRILTGRWDTKVSFMLIIAGVGTVFASSHLPNEATRNINGLMALFIVGHTLFTGLCGSWLARADARANESKKE